MENQGEIQKYLDAFDKEIRKDHIENEIEKQKFAKQMKSGLGEKISDYNTYIKKEPSFLQKFKTKLRRFFRYI
jgi:glycine cleavage system H lipoate-binding protein